MGKDLSGLSNVVQQLADKMTMNKMIVDKMTGKNDYSKVADKIILNKMTVVKMTVNGLALDKWSDIKCLLTKCH